MIAIKPLANLKAVVGLPGSKSLTQRAMAIAALAQGESRLKNILIADDTLILAEALRKLGVEIRQSGADVVIQGAGGAISGTGRAMSLGNNGTALRLLAGIVSLGKGQFLLTGDNRLCERPLKPLLDALAVLGVESHTEGEKGYPPVTIVGGGLRGGKVVLCDIGSSQYVSSLLIAAPYAAGAITIVLEGRIPSLPYIALTIETMDAFGVRVASAGDNRYIVQSGQFYRGREFTIEGDASSASYFFLAAALLKGRIRVENINPQTRQGDIGFLDLLENLGCAVSRENQVIEVLGKKMPNGEMVFDMAKMPDIVPSLAVLCAARQGRSVIRNVAHLRLKESDRIAALAAELRKTGIAALEMPDGLIIEGGVPHGARIKTYNDHRIAMSFAILGLSAPGMEIEDEACVGKSFPGFWKALEGLY
ncbi:MAG: 3-phosphoshikimate 1-carboxyvinyltransferase [Syntrophales bacterium]|jgi:3-phosphoshikimate 1-carboxyvinyltransferase|nr:3-phosphoshikimate 1-carboxyvinyltransferase [Syntrophales bacterium]